MTRVAAPAHDRDLFARAARVRKLIAKGLIDPLDGLACVIFPSEEFLEYERRQSPAARHSVLYRSNRDGS